MAFKIQDLIFLSPAQITYLNDGKPETMKVSVDLINQRLYHNGDRVVEPLEKALFDYIHKKNTLPEDFFAAPTDLTERVTDLQKEQDLKNYGVTNGR